MDIELISFYSLVTGENLDKYVRQWRSLVACAQERIVYRKALQYLGPRDICLDWGCGNGHFSYFLNAAGFRPVAYALDQPPALVSLASIPYTAGNDVTLLPFESGQFDAVFGVGVLEHVYERGGNERGSLLELARVLRPGGKLFIFHLPNRFSWLEWLVRLLYRLGISAKLPHEKRYTEESFRSLLEDSGLTVIEHGRYHLLPRAIFNRLPAAFNDSPLFCATINALDDSLAFMLRPICQNWFFILQNRL